MVKKKINIQIHESMSKYYMSLFWVKITFNLHVPPHKDSECEWRLHTARAVNTYSQQLNADLKNTYNL